MSKYAYTNHALPQALRGLTRGDAYSAFQHRTPTEIVAIATRMEQVADFFEDHPNLRCKGMELSGKGLVCAIGAVRYSRKVGLSWDPFASKNCNADETIWAMEYLDIVSLNDSSMPAEQFRTYLRNVARVLKKWAKTKPRNQHTFADAFVNDGYFKMLATKNGVSFKNNVWA